MGLKERQEREREAVSRAILDAARDLFVSEGYRNVSIRKIAERIEYSPAAIYSYFPSKDDIFYALAEEGFRQLCTPGPQCGESADTLDAVRAPFWRIYQFSKSHPEYFALMFVDRTVPRISQNWERFGFVREMQQQVGVSIQRAIDAAFFPPGTRPEAVFRILLTAIYGAAVCRLAARSQPGEDSDALARDTLEATLLGLRTGITQTFHPVTCSHPNIEASR